MSFYATFFRPFTDAWGASGRFGAGPASWRGQIGTIINRARYPGTRNAPTSAQFSAPSMLGAPASLAFSDYTALLDDEQITLFVMDLVTPSGNVRVPISSFQATNTTNGQSYAGCVVPGAGAWRATLSAATRFVVSRRGLLLSGEYVYQQMCDTPLSTLQIDQGSTNYTASLSGYTDEFPTAPDPSDPDAIFDRDLTDIRTISTYSNSTRIRCAIDWLLLPATRANFNGTSMVVGFVNYYVIQGDSYMDVGSLVVDA